MAFVALGGDAAANSPEIPASTAVSDDLIEVYVVQPGDTLWGIATTLAEPGDNVQGIVDVLRESAGSANLDVGQRIVIDHAEFGG